MHRQLESPLPDDVIRNQPELVPAVPVDLAPAVPEGLRELAQLYEEVRTMRDQLQARNEELEAFAYAVAHDLRRPLRALDGFSQALLEDHATALDGEAQEYLRRIRRGTQQMGQLITDLLVLSRITRRPLYSTSVDLSGLARNLAERFQETSPERQVTIRISDGLVADADAQAVRSVLENLLGNAWKFTGKHPSAQIEFGMTVQSGERVYFVRDDGAGFNMKHANKLFGAFQRLHSLGEFDGNGIGLAIVQRLVHMHGGRTWAEAAVEQGATLYFTLGPPSPVQDDTQEPEHVYGAAAATGPSAAGRAGASPEIGTPFALRGNP